VAKVIKMPEPPQRWEQVRARAKHRWLVPYYALDWACAHTAYFLNRWSFLEVLESAGSLSVLVAVIFWFAGAGERTQQRHYQAWQVINTAQGKSGNGGRIDALQELAADDVSLIAVDVRDAYLQNIRLPNGQLHRANFSGADMRGAVLTGADLSQAQLYGTNLRGATLHGANVSETEFDNADLVGADLSGLADWSKIKSVSGANIREVQNAPKGFVEWALAHGATQASD
jgi:Pentapeptide repeats (8 copies)